MIMTLTCRKLREFDHWWEIDGEGCMLFPITCRMIPEALLKAGKTALKRIPDWLLCRPCCRLATTELPRTRLTALEVDLTVEPYRLLHANMIAQSSLLYRF